MKINRTNSPPPATETDASNKTTREAQNPGTQPPRSPTPENSATSNRFNQPHVSDTSASNARLPPELGGPASSQSLKNIEDSLLVVARKVLASKTPADAHSAREEVIDIIIHENFHNQLNSREQRQITDTLKLALSNDPLFCAEVDRMLQLAAKKLGGDS